MSILYTMAVSVVVFFGLATQTVAASQYTAEPTKIIVPTAQIDLPVFTAAIAYNTWETSETTASFGKGSAIPGSIGNTVIFAHARPGLFGSLDKVAVGDHIHIFTAVDWFVYRVTDVLVVSPEDVSILKQQKGTELTLFTCTSPKDSHRLVIKAALVANTL